MAGLRNSFFSCVRQSSNSIAHFLVKFAKYISNDVTWMENLSPLALEVLFFDVNVSRM